MTSKLAFQLFSNMGLRYTSYRIFHEVEKRLGILKKRHPKHPKQKKFISLEDWKKQKIPFVIPEREILSLEKIQLQSLKVKAEKIRNGEICFFSWDYKNLGASYDWLTNPDTNYQYDIQKHWSEINDFNPENGDIKYVWEKSRFTYLLTIMRYDYHFEEDHAAFVFAEIESWINANPINQGPNWKCSQEISLRIINWLYVIYFYKNSSALTNELWNKIQHTIYWSLHHVYHHINFSRIAVRNNHAITETLFLTVSELLFPFIPDTKKWAAKGRKWLEKEIAYQVYNDGTFLQFSMNYHRVLTQLFSFGIALTEKHNKPFSKLFYSKAYKSLNFLYQCLQCENGYLPNYGANDGALFFPLTENEYRNYKSQLNALHQILTGTCLFDDNVSKEEYYWFQTHAKPVYHFDKLAQKIGFQSFENGGYYICRTAQTFTFIRCGSHKDRPSHADNLHLDVWVNGENILRDSGTYKYNTSKEFSDYFTGTKAHNTVTVNEQSQMLKGSRFIWYYWTQCNHAKWEETKDHYIFQGSISAFKQLHAKGMHHRQIKISKSLMEWIINDEVLHLDAYSKKQIWHIDEKNVIFSIAKPESKSNETSYDSSFYGQKKEGKAISFTFDTSIETKITYQI